MRQKARTWNPFATNRFQIAIITDTEIGPNRTFQMILLSHLTQFDLLISSWLTSYCC